MGRMGVGAKHVGSVCVTVGSLWDNSIDRRLTNKRLSFCVEVSFIPTESDGQKKGGNSQVGILFDVLVVQSPRSSTPLFLL